MKFHILIIALILLTACGENELIWEDSMGADPHGAVLVQRQGKPSLEDYWREALIAGEFNMARLDQAGPAAILLQNEFSSIEEIQNFMDENNYGVCRQRSALGYWLLRQLYPKKADSIWMVSGTLQEEGMIVVDAPDDLLDMNHVWVEMDNLPVDFTGERIKAVYIPYVRSKIVSGGGWLIEPDLDRIRAKYVNDQ